MATKFYLNNVVPLFQPTPKGAWDSTASLLTLLLGTNQFGGVRTKLTVGETAVSNPNSNLMLRAISSKLQPQTISGTFDVIIGVDEADADADYFWYVHAYVSQGDTDAVRGTLINNYAESSNEWPITILDTGVGHALVAPVALSSVAALSGDRIVVELGFISRNAFTTNRNAAIWYGTQSFIVLDDIPDLVVGDVNTSIKAGTVTFSQDLLFESVTAEIAHAVDQIVEETPPASARIAHIKTEVAEDPPIAVARLAHIIIHVVQGKAIAPIPGIDMSGIYTINPTKFERHDSYYNNIEKKIPDPTIKTALIGE